MFHQMMLHQRRLQAMTETRNYPMRGKCFGFAVLSAFAFISEQHHKFEERLEALSQLEIGLLESPSLLKRFDLEAYIQTVAVAQSPSMMSGLLKRKFVAQEEFLTEGHLFFSESIQKSGISFGPKVVNSFTLDTFSEVLFSFLHTLAVHYPEAHCSALVSSRGHAVMAGFRPANGTLLLSSVKKRSCIIAKKKKEVIDFFMSDFNKMAGTDRITLSLIPMAGGKSFDWKGFCGHWLNHGHTYQALSFYRTKMKLEDAETKESLLHSLADGGYKGEYLLVCEQNYLKDTNSYYPVAPTFSLDSIEEVGTVMIHLYPQKINQKDKEGSTPLLCAIHMRHDGYSKLLLEQGAHPDTPNFSGVTPLMAAVLRENHDLVELLLEKGININRRDYKGHTALYLAVFQNDEIAVQLILAKNPHMEFLYQGDTILEVAEEHECSEIILLIQRHLNQNQSTIHGFSNRAFTI